MSEAKRNASSGAEKDESPAAKRARQEDDDEKEILDLASTFGLKDGDRIEVAWQVNDEEEMHWWGATLLPWNKEIVDDCVAVRELKYDAYPEGGFDEESIEKVVFLGDNLLAYPDTNEELNYRREGDDFTNEEGSPLRADPSELVEQTLKNVLAKHGRQLALLPASEQAAIAAQIAKKREELVAHLQAHASQGVVTKSRMQEILASVSNGERAGAKAH